MLVEGYLSWLRKIRWRLSWHGNCSLMDLYDCHCNEDSTEKARPADF
jgi:hypothetical protein